MAYQGPVNLITYPDESADPCTLEQDCLHGWQEAARCRADVRPERYVPGAVLLI
jgi:hypothetical protein